MDMEDAGGTRLARVTRDPQIFLCNYLNGVWPQLDVNRAFPMKKYREISVCRAGL